MQCIQKDDRLELNNRHLLFLGITVGAWFMVFDGISTLIQCFPPDSGEDRIADLFGIAFLSVWTAVAFGMGLFALLTFTAKITVSKQGIAYRYGFKTRLLPWPEVSDWGLTYCGQTRGEGNTYYLYFSREYAETKNDERKKLGRGTVRQWVFDGDLPEIHRTVFPFCRQYTGVQPFVPAEKKHLF